MANVTETPDKSRDRDVLWQSRREEILVHAAQLFAERGYSETDTTLLAETVGVGKGTVYRYFPSKRELFLAAADRVMRMLKQAVEEQIADISDPIDQVKTAIRAFLAFFAEHPAFVELLMQERAHFKDRTRPTFMEHRQANIARWHALYRDLIAAGRIREMPVERISEVLGNLLYGTIFTNYFSGQTRSVDKQTQDVIDILFRGIATPAELQRMESVNQLPGANT